MKKSVFCEFDDDGVYVYQALNPSIVALAVEQGTFGKNFDQGRTSWIKPSFSWILQHTYAGTKHNMKAVARVKIHHWAWLEILENSELSHYNDDLHGDRMLWQNSLKKAKVICQWDPEKGLDGNPLGRQSIQLGLKAPILKDYVERYIIQVEDASALARLIAPYTRAGRRDFPVVPEEREYPLEDELAERLGCGARY